MEKNIQTQHEQAIALLNEKHLRELRELLCEMEPADIALFMSEVPEEDMPLIFRLLPKELAAEVFVEMDSDEEQLLIHSFNDIELRSILDELFADDTADIIEEMPANVVSRMLKNIAPDRRNQINELLRYPEDSAGSVMTVEYIDLRESMTVEDAFKRIRRTGLNRETVYTCYVTDKNRHLIGLITALTLMISGEDSLIGDIMETNVISVETTDEKTFVATQIKKYDLLALPVVDRETRLVGIVTVDDAIDVLSQAVEEDIQKMSAVTPLEDSYFKTSVLTHAKNRILWLLLLMFSATFSGIIITRYEDAFEVIPVLVAFLPMLMGTGGNCGSQASTMIIRGLALNEIRLSDFPRALFKEFRVGILIGISLGILNFIRVIIQYRDVKLGIVLGLTVCCVSIVAKCLGCILPMLVKTVKLDPAIMASPLIATILDCFTIFVYFNIALVVLGLTI